MKSVRYDVFSLWNIAEKKTMTFVRLNSDRTCISKTAALVDTNNEMMKEFLDVLASQLIKQFHIYTVTIMIFVRR